MTADVRVGPWNQTVARFRKQWTDQKQQGLGLATMTARWVRVRTYQSDALGAVTIPEDDA